MEDQIQTLLWYRVHIECGLVCFIFKSRYQRKEAEEGMQRGKQVSCYLSPGPLIFQFLVVFLKRFTLCRQEPLELCFIVQGSWYCSTGSWKPDKSFPLIRLIPKKIKASLVSCSLSPPFPGLGWCLHNGVEALSVLFYKWFGAFQMSLELAAVITTLVLTVPRPSTSS